MEPKFFLVVQRKLAQHFLAFSSQGQPHLASVVLHAVAPNIATRGEPVHQFNRTVMPNLQALGQFSDSRMGLSVQSLQCQHQLMLVWFDAGGARSLLAEMQKAADLIAQVGQGLVVGCGNRSSHAKKYIVRRCL